ncbi:MAG: 2'-5' RNA ligase family protein [Thermomicrobiales bacterium]
MSADVEERAQEPEAALATPDRSRRPRIPNWIRHPLWWMPDIPAEQQRSFDRIWNRFETIAMIEDGRHDTDAWTSRAGDFILCCVKIPREALGPEYEDLRETLGAATPVRLHPPEFLHITVQEIGFVVDKPSSRDEFTAARLDEFLGYIDGPIGDFNPFTIELAGINSFSDAAFFNIRDNGWLSRIHFRMRDFVIIPPNKHFPYLPITTIANYTESAPAADLRELLIPFRDTSFGTFQVEEIDILRLNVREPYPELRIERTIKLGTHRIEAPVRPLPIDPLEDRI